MPETVMFRCGPSPDLVGPDRPFAGLQRGGVGLLARFESPSEVGLLRAPELLALPVDQLHEVTGAADVEDRPGRVLDVRQGRHLRLQRLGHRGLGGALDDLLAGDHCTGVLVRALEEVVECLLHRVRQDEGPAHHRDAEDDRQRGERRAQLAAQQALQRRGLHR
jgi:hypothetical protein